MVWVGLSSWASFSIFADDVSFKFQSSGSDGCNLLQEMLQTGSRAAFWRFPGERLALEGHFRRSMAILFRFFQKLPSFNFGMFSILFHELNTYISLTTVEFCLLLRFIFFKANNSVPVMVVMVIMICARTSQLGLYRRVQPRRLDARADPSRACVVSESLPLRWCGAGTTRPSAPPKELGFTRKPGWNL